MSNTEKEVKTRPSSKFMIFFLISILQLLWKQVTKYHTILESNKRRAGGKLMVACSNDHKLQGRRKNSFSDPLITSF